MSTRQKILVGSLFISIAVSSVSQADINVGAGWDLFYTDDSTTFMGVNWEGVPLGDFDFGGTTGVQDVHGIDTIVQRLEQASVAGDGQTDTIDIELVALQLVSVDPVDLGAGLGDHYITLQAGQSTMGKMAISFDNQYG